MELKQIRYFIAVAESGNVTRAARRLFIAQPALTRQIQALERELGVALFERKNRRLTLTFAGEVFLNRTRQLVEHIAQTNSLMEEVARGATAILRIAAGPVPMHHVVLPAAAEFRERWPQFHIQMQEAGYGSAMALLERGDADLAIGAPLSNNRGLAWEHLYTPRLYALLSPEHRLADRDYLTVQELAHEDLLFTRASQSNQLARELLFHFRGLQIRSVFESDLTETTLRGAELKFGIVITTDTVDFYPRNLEAIPVLDGNRQVEFEVVVAWVDGRSLPAMTEDLIQLLREFGEKRSTKGYVPWMGESVVNRR